MEPQPAIEMQHAHTLRGLVLVLALVLVIGGGFYLATGGAPDTEVPAVSIQPPPQTPEEAAAAEAAQREATLNTAREAIISGNDDACAALPEGQEQITCRAYAAIAKAQSADDPGLCAEITDEYWNMNCRDQVMTYRAVKEKKPTLCDQLIVEGRIPSCKTQAAQ
jgi:hypothetical protein